MRPLEKWTASDVQTRLDEHHRKRRLLQHQSMCPADNLQPTLPVRVLHGHLQTTESTSTVRPQAESRPLPTEGHSLKHVITLLERLLLRETSQCSRPPRTGSRTRSRSPCVICGDPDHDTGSHWKRDRLCFRCHVAGHQAVGLSPLRRLVDFLVNMLLVDKDFFSFSLLLICALLWFGILHTARAQLAAELQTLP